MGERLLDTEHIEHNHPLLHDARQPTRHRILIALKVLGEASAKTLGTHLHLTPMGVRRHLNILRDEGWVDYRVFRHGQGRPTHLYFLTPKAMSLFDQRYAALSVELLCYLAEEQGEEVVSHLFQRRAERRVKEAQEALAGLPLEQRVAQLAAILNRDGYMAEWEKDGEEYCICEHHCAIQDVAHTFPQACETELTFIRELLPDATVERERNIVRGDHCCMYRIRPR